ncbi:10566_t:CDS:10 [Paraglomus occultum]|uniref:10566_t:CDS:1 n=1 Tax=Paraglomus occultum TaxID=144539 RepID=A0A9N8ZRI5_9GLOM|nr:10566_t:CDS:10 [Paraglomus occultum]
MLITSNIYQAVNSQFFGAHTFQVKIARDWKSLPDDRKIWLRDELFRWLIHFSNGPSVVTTKLSTALAAYTINAIPNVWTNCIAELFQYLQSGAMALGRQDLAVELPLLEYLTVISVHKELKDAIPLVMSTLQSFLAQNDQSQRGILLKQKSLRCLESWIAYNVPFESLLPLINHVIELFPCEETHESATEVLIQFLDQPSVTSIQDTVCDLIMRCFASEWTKSRIAKAFNESDEHAVKNLCRLMTVFGDTFTNYIAKHFIRPDIMIYLEMMLTFTGFPEAIYDPYVIPIQSNSPEDNDNNVLEFGNAALSSQQSAEEARHIRDAAIILFKRLIEILRVKLQLPPEDEWNEWHEETKQKFRSYRRDIGDIILSAYVILHEELLAYLIDLIAKQLNTPNSNDIHYEDAESTLYCIKAISESMSSSENTYLPRLFGAEIYGRLPSHGQTRLRNTALVLIGSYAEWLNENPDFLLPAINYIMASLNEPGLSFSAATAFKDVCELCRNHLVNVVENMVNAYLSLGSHVQPLQRQKIIESIADVLQNLPLEKMVKPILVLTGHIIEKSKEFISHSVQEPSIFRDSIMIQLGYLTSCARGIQARDDEPILVDADKDNLRIQAVFASTTVTSFTSTITDIVGRIANIWYQDQDVMESVCKFINAGIRYPPHLLSLPLDFIVHLIQNFYSRQQHPCLMDTAAQLLTVYGSRNEYKGVFEDILETFTVSTLIVINQNDIEDCPDVVNSYFELLSKFIMKCPVSFYSIPSDMFKSIIMFSIASLRTNERLALKAAINFMKEFLGQSYHDDQLNAASEKVIMTYGLEIMTELLAGIGGKTPRSYVPSVADVLYKMTSRHVEASSNWLRVLLSQDNFPSPNVKQDAKDLFAKSILGTRNIRRYKDLVNEFSLKCRGLENTAYGRV